MVTFLNIVNQKPGMPLTFSSTADSIGLLQAIITKHIWKTSTHQFFVHLSLSKGSTKLAIFNWGLSHSLPLFSTPEVGNVVKVKGNDLI